jgi:hypothetical protein
VSSGWQSETWYEINIHGKEIAFSRVEGWWGWWEGIPFKCQHTSFCGIIGGLEIAGIPYCESLVLALELVTSVQ